MKDGLPKFKDLPKEAGGSCVGGGELNYLNRFYNFKLGQSLTIEFLL